MSTIYAHDSIKRKPKCGISKFTKNTIRVVPKYINCNLACGVKPIDDLVIAFIKKHNPSPGLDVSTNKMVFKPEGETKPLVIYTDNTWIIR